VVEISIKRGVGEEKIRNWGGRASIVPPKTIGGGKGNAESFMLRRAISRCRMLTKGGKKSVLMPRERGPMLFVINGRGKERRQHKKEKGGGEKTGAIVERD